MMLRTTNVATGAEDISGPFDILYLTKAGNEVRGKYKGNEEDIQVLKKQGGEFYKDDVHVKDIIFTER